MAQNRGETIKILRSNTPNATPSLTAGEIAVNMSDKKLFVGAADGAPITFISTPSIVSSIGVGLSSFTDAVSITSGSNVTISTANNRITISSSGSVGTTGDTIVSGGSSQLFARSNNSVTIDNRVADTSVTGVASFNNTYFSVANGAVSLATAYQATGDTVITSIPASASGLFYSTSGKTKTFTNTGVTGIQVGAITLTGNVSLTNGSNVTLTRSGNQITIASNGSVGGGDTVYGDSGSVVVSNPSANNKYVTVKNATSVVLNANGTVANQQPNDGKPHGITGVATFDHAHFIVNPDLGIVRIANPAFTFSGSGLGASANSDGSLAYTYLDIGNLTAASESLDTTNDAILYYDASTNTTKKMVPQQFLLDQASLFTIDVNTPAEIYATPYEENNFLSAQIKFSIPPGTISAGSSGFARGSAVYSYVGANTVASANGCTGALTITGTANEIEVTKSCPTITIGLPDNVSIPYLSVTGATFTQTVTANRFVGTVSGGDF